ncbi:hypothetical protein [Dokdonella fugitiva]|jgi:hypothetical protein|uniref:Uncharacterized protein n=1 Tax=Dokdonella fugitiva TaxID=328517 RepID=A0A4R2IE67_9GAMM|nr:hypothetical protein [Dokdonella fugitiva]TCO42943.1 hypothetical protein EV148_101350 [Dokdonella fugitiva]
MVARILVAGIVFALGTGLAAASDEPLPIDDAPIGDMTPTDYRQVERDL